MRQHFNTDNIGPSYDMMILSDFRTFVAFSTAMFLQIRQKKTYFAEKVLNFYQRNLIQNPSWSHNNSQKPWNIKSNILFLSLLYFWCCLFYFQLQWMWIITLPLSYRWVVIIIYGIIRLLINHEISLIYFYHTSLFEIK